MGITITDKQYENYGNCKVISNGLIELYVTADVGPRIIRASIAGKDNLMFNDIERKAAEDVSSEFGEGKKWYIYGGHRLWVSPEHMPLTYYPDCEEVDVAVDGNTVTFTPPAQKVNNLQHKLIIKMCDSTPCADVTHIIENLGDKEVTGAAWALSVMAPGGTVICPMPDEDTGLLGNRVLALWPYTRMTDSRMVMGDKYITVKQNSAISEKFKFGINNTKKWIAYVNKGQALIKRYSPNHPNGIYPDFGVSTEVFTNNLFIEAETLSELITIQKGESITHTEMWEIREAPECSFQRGKECEIDTYVDKYLK